MAHIVSTTSRKRKKTKTPLCIFFVLLAVLAVFAILKFKGEKRGNPVVEPPVEVHVKPIEEVKPIETNQVQETVSAPVEKVEEVAEVITKIRPTKDGYCIMPNGKEKRFKLPPEGKTVSFKCDGILYRCDSEGNFEDISAPKIFDNPLENQLIGLSVDGGSFASGFLLRHSDEEVMKVLKTPVEILETDSETVKAKKAAVAEMKGIILDYIEQGGTYEQFVLEVASFTKQERKFKREGIKKIVSMLKEGKADEAKAYYESLNNALATQNMPPLKLHHELAEKIGLNEEEPKAEEVNETHEEAIEEAEEVQL